MKATSKAVVVLCMLSCASVADAEKPRTMVYKSSTWLGETCTSKDPTDLLPFCGSYIVGVQDTIAMMRITGFLKDDQIPFCLPEHVSQLQLIAAVKKYFASKPEAQEKGQQVMAPVDVMGALIEAFPCRDR
jgi:hypothetical protein